MNTNEPADSFCHPVKAALQNLVDRLITNLLPVAVRNNSFIINDVPSELGIDGNESSVADVLSGILRSVICNAKESCIRISAKLLYGKMLVVSVKDSNSFNTYAVACSLQDVLPLAQKIGGELDISNHQKITTIAFRFPVGHEGQLPMQAFG